MSAWEAWAFSAGEGFPGLSGCFLTSSCKLYYFLAFKNCFLSLFSLTLKPKRNCPPRLQILPSYVHLTKSKNFPLTLQPCFTASTPIGKNNTKQILNRHFTPNTMFFKHMLWFQKVVFGKFTLAAVGESSTGGAVL